MDPTNKTMSADIGGREVMLYFNANMQMKFEELTNQFFMDWFVDLTLHAQRFFITSIEERAGEVDTELTDTDRADQKVTAAKLVEKLKEQVSDQKVMGLLKLIETRKFIALIAAAAHEYDDRDEPKWLFTPGKLGSMLDHGDILRLFSPIFLKLMHNFTPGPTTRAKPADEDKSAEAPRPTGPTPVTKPRGGGKAFGPSEDAVLGSLKRKSGA